MAFIGAVFLPVHSVITTYIMLPGTQFDDLRPDSRAGTPLPIT